MNSEPSYKGAVTLEELEEIDDKLNEMALVTNDTNCAMLSLMADEKCRDLINQAKNGDGIEKYPEYRKMMAMVDGAISIFDDEVERNEGDRMRTCDECEGDLEFTEETEYIRFYKCVDCGLMHTKKVGFVTKEDLDTEGRY